MKKEDLPKKISVFPLSNFIIFPKTTVPLNIFEPRYLALINDCIKSNKYMGMIQAKKNSSDVYSIGCLGKITENKKTKDGRVLINLTGISRFEVKNEINNDKHYREFEVSYAKYEDDLKLKEQLKKTEKFEELSNKTKQFFARNGLLLDWKEFEKLDQDQRVNTLAMIAPISNEEKQTILESVNIQTKASILSEIIEFYLHENSASSLTLQ